MEQENETFTLKSEAVSPPEYVTKENINRQCKFTVAIVHGSNIFRLHKVAIFR